MSTDYDTDDYLCDEFQHKMTTSISNKKVLDVKSIGDDLIYYFDDNSISLVDTTGKSLATKKWVEKISTIAACPEYFTVFLGDSFQCFKIEPSSHHPDIKLIKKIKTRFYVTDFKGPVKYADMQNNEGFAGLVVGTVHGSSVNLHKLKGRSTDYLHFREHGKVCSMSFCNDIKFIACAFDTNFIKVFSIKGNGLFGVFSCEKVFMSRFNNLFFSRTYDVLSYMNADNDLFLYEVKGLYFQSDRKKPVEYRTKISLKDSPDARVVDVDYKGMNYQVAKKSGVIETVVNSNLQKVCLTTFNVQRDGEMNRTQLSSEYGEDIDHDVEEVSDDDSDIVKIEATEEDAWIDANGRTVKFEDVLPLIPENKDYHYMSCYPKRGLFVILNFKYTNDEDEDEDERRLEEMANKLDFEEVCVRRIKEVRTASKKFYQSASEFTEAEEANKQIEEIVKVYKRHLQESDCFVCVFLSNKVFTVSRDMTRAVEPGNCQALAGKPKLFFIQAPRGDKIDMGFNSYHVNSQDQPSTSRAGSHSNHEGENSNQLVAPSVRHLMHHEDIDKYPKQIPSQADLLIAFSTCKDYRSCTKTKKEVSPYIRYLTSVINKYYATHDLLSMLTHVNYMMSNEYVNEEDESKQMPSFVSQLTRKVRFIPKKEYRPKN